MKKLWLLSFLCLLSAFSVSAQELSCRVQVNSDKIQGTNKQVFTTLQQAITEYINTRKWSEAQIAVNEKIDCSILIIVNSVTDTRYSCEIQVQSRRPVYNCPILRRCSTSAIRSLSLPIRSTTRWCTMR